MHNFLPITILKVTHKLLLGVIYNRLLPYSEVIGDYQSGFRPSRSTVHNIFTIRQIQKAYEYDIDIHSLDIDFQQAFDNIDRNKML